MSEIVNDISIKGIGKIALPIMISSLSFNLMLFVNRAFLAHYDLFAMNAIAAVGITITIFQYTFVGIASMSEVIAGKLNGAKRYKDVSSPAWQMIWFGILSSFFLIPLALFAGEYVIPENYLEYGLPFFQILTSSIFLSVISHGINGFFVGIGKTSIISISTLISNGVNIILDYILIFGVEGKIDAMGTSGAAIATTIAMAVQLLILSSVFFSSKYHERYRTRDYHFHFDNFKECLRIGYPNSISHFIEMSAWTASFWILASLGEEYVTVHVINLNIFLLLVCVNDGVQKAIISIVSNLIGANKISMIEYAVKKAVILLSFSVLLISCFVLLFSREIITFIFDIDAHGSIDIESVIMGVKWSLLFLLLDGISWVIYGVLVAFGDTKFIMYTNGPSSWLLVILPLYLFSQTSMITLYSSWQLVCIYPIICSIIGRWRYKTKHLKIG